MKLENVRIYDKENSINRAYLGNKLIFNKLATEFIYYYPGQIYCGDIYCGEKHINDQT